MIRRPPRTTRTDTLFPYTTLFRSAYVGYKREVVPGLTADVGLLYYYYPKDSNIATDYFEPYVSLSGSLGPVNAKVGLNYAWGGQNALGNDDSIYAYSDLNRSEEHTSELQSLMRTSYAVFSLK